MTILIAEDDPLTREGLTAIFEAEGYTVPGWVKSMLASGRESFYGRDEAGQPTYWSIEGAAKPVETNPNHLFISDIKAAHGKPVARNPSASVHDAGDGILLLEFHSKMNALDDGIFDMYEFALDQLDAGTYDGLVVEFQSGALLSTQTVSGIDGITSTFLCRNQR